MRIFPRPVLLAVIVALLVMETVFGASTVIVRPTADVALPEVFAESVPPLEMVTVSALIETLPPAPVSSVFVKTPLPAPSTRKEFAGLFSPWIVTVPALPAPVEAAVMVPPPLSVMSFALSRMLPALPGPVVLAETDAPFEMLTDFPAIREMLPPAPASGSTPVDRL